MKKLVLILLLLPILAAGQELKTEKHKNRRHSQVKGYITANYLAQTYSHSSYNTFADMKSGDGYSFGLGIKNTPHNYKIGYRLGIEYCKISSSFTTVDYVSNTELTDKYSYSYIKPYAGLVLDRPLSYCTAFHFDAGVNFWCATSSTHIYGSLAAGAGIGFSWCLLRVGYEYGVGKLFDGLLIPSFEKIHASTVSVGLIFYPTGI